MSVPGALAGERPCDTDLKGNRLCTPVTAETWEYAFSPAESAFYETPSAFILDGCAYASILDGWAQSARMHSLIALQTLAASSIAAIQSALTKCLPTVADSMTRPGIRSEMMLLPDQNADT